MNRTSRRKVQKQQIDFLKGLKLTDKLVELEREKWPEVRDSNLIEVFVSKKYLVQIFDTSPLRITINRVKFNGNSWSDNISWDEIQNIKDSIGFSDLDAVEIYPRERDIVNVANMRHIFVMETLIPYAWRSK